MTIGFYALSHSELYYKVYLLRGYTFNILLLLHIKDEVQICDTFINTYS